MQMFFLVCILPFQCVSDTKGVFPEVYVFLLSVSCTRTPAAAWGGTGRGQREEPEVGVLRVCPSFFLASLLGVTLRSRTLMSAALLVACLHLHVRSNQSLSVHVLGAGSAGLPPSQSPRASPHPLPPSLWFHLHFPNDCKHLSYACWPFVYFWRNVFSNPLF